MNNNYLNCIIKDDKLYFVEDFRDENLNDYYIIKNKGSMVCPVVTFYKFINGDIIDEKIIESRKDLIDFLFNNKDDNVIVMIGFSKSSISSFLMYTKKIKIESNKSILVKKL